MADNKVNEVKVIVWHGFHQGRNIKGVHVGTRPLSRTVLDAVTSEKLLPRASFLLDATRVVVLLWLLQML
jgi:hypothetical protein